MLQRFGHDLYQLDRAPNHSEVQSIKIQGKGYRIVFCSFLPLSMSLMKLTDRLLHKAKTILPIGRKDTNRLPSKESSLRYLRESGMSISSILDVGVQHETNELKEIFPDVRHFLFEPVEEYYSYIEHNYRDLDHVLVKAALSNKNGSEILQIKKLKSTTVTHSSLETSTEKEDFETRVVQTQTLDTFLKTQNGAGPYLLKIDVDGHEMAILEGSVETLKRTSCVIIEAPLHTLPERLNYLESKGFYLWDIVDLCYYYNNLHQVDLIFLSNHEKQRPAFSPWQNYEFSWQAWKPFLR
ncbi:MAG: FkbM family methyltransferase [Nodosilinea sp.]